MHGIVDEKTDVYAFGVLLLELISGRRALDYSQRSLVTWVSFCFCFLFYTKEQSVEIVYLFSQAKPLLKKNEIQELVDPFLSDDQYESRRKKNQILELVDPFLADDHYNPQQMNLLALAASLCIQRSAIQRPEMRQACNVVFFLEIPESFMISE